MLNNEHQEFDCTFHDQLVPYMYGELAESERGVFETHLADCSACTDEFAGISAARFSVFEWHKEAFMPLATPEFVIPYEPATLAAPARAGWFAGLTEIFAFARSPIAIAVSLAVVLGVGAAFLYLAPAVDQPDVAGVPALIPTAPSIMVFTPENEKAPDQVKAKDVSTPPIVKAVDVQRKPARKPRALEARRLEKNVSVPASLKTTAKRPLSTYADDDDETLRLAALFDEIGG